MHIYTVTYFIAEISEHMTPIVVEAAIPKASESKQKIG